MAPGTTPDDARASLGGDPDPARRRRRGRRAGAELLVLGIGMGVVTLTVGLVDSRALGAAVFATWGVLALGTSHWERLRAARRGRDGARTAPLWGLSFAGYVIAIAAGTENGGDPGYWIPAALLVALPVLVAALRERRA